MCFYRDIGADAGISVPRCYAAELADGGDAFVLLLEDMSACRVGELSRVRMAFTGTSLTLTTLGRSDLLKSKLFALCDRGTDLADCIAMAPSAVELDEAEPWLAERDANPMWPDHVRATLDDLRGRLGHGV